MGDNTSSISPMLHHSLLLQLGTTATLPKLLHTITHTEHGHIPELTILQAQEQRGIAGLAGEICKAFGVPEELVLHVLELQGPLQPTLLQRGFVQVKESLDDEDVILQEALDGHSAAGADG